MRTRITGGYHAGRITIMSAAAVGLFLLPACASSKPKAAGASGTSAGDSSAPGTAFSTANISGLGTVVVDGRGRTVYLLTSGDGKNVPCEDSTGCTKVWPDLPFPDGVKAAKAGTGLSGSLLGTMKLSDGETYPTYGGWLMYEYSKDGAPGQGHGEGIHSFGGTWYALSPSGQPVMGGASTTATTAQSSGGGYGY